MLLNILFILLAVGVLLLTVTIILHIFLPVPYVPTPNAVVDRMIDLAELKGYEVVHDLGAGDARILIAIKRRYPNIRVIGYEFVPTIWLYGKIRSWWAGANIELRLGSVERAEIRDADVVFLYLIPSLMEKLEHKFDRELKKGARVISSSFAFSKHSSAHQEVFGGKKLFVYTWMSVSSTRAATR